MKFSEMTYQRPDFEALYSTFKQLTAQMESAKDESAFFAAGEEINRLSATLMTAASLCHVRHAIDTRDAFYEEEQNQMDEQLPRFQEITSDVARIVLASPFKEQFAEKYGRHLLEKYELRLKTFKPEIIEELVEENKLSSAYEKLIASAQIEFEGKTYNLSGMGPFTQSTDRDVRRRANDIMWGWLSDHQDGLDDLYDKLVKVRHQIGLKLGYENFIPVAYARMGRTDWNQQDAKVYREQIASSVVPFAQKLYQEQAERLGISDMKNFDYNLEFLSGNPKPQGEEEYLVKQAQTMYGELSAETGAFFNMMVDSGLMDLTTKPGKRGGGFMTSFPDYRVPFIFSNFNGTSGDVDVLTHEAGHAFQGYLQRDIINEDLKDMTMEVAEIHSMSMEFFTHPWMEKFFGPDTEKYFYSHVADAVKFLPYGASIDELQEWVYEHPEATPAERRAQYRKIEQKYLPHLDYNGLTYLENGGRWQKQAHVYSMPFYYLDYTISQVCAFQYFVWDRKDHQAAWQSYLNICRKAGLMPFKRLARECGLMSPFEDGCIAKVIPELEAYMDGLDKSRIR